MDYHINKKLAMNDKKKIKCIKCDGNDFQKYSTLWKCIKCNSIYPCFNGMPKIYVENNISAQDKSLRDFFYNGLLGKFYQSAMPFLTLPARPFNKSKKDWILYFLFILVFCEVIYKNINIALGREHFTEIPTIIINIISILLLLVIINFFIKHSYFFYLLILAIPVKISLSINKFRPKAGFQKIHNDIIEKFLLTNNQPLQILDISTGTGNSLYRHGWMRINAEYTGLDLSETMLAQCQTFMVTNQVPIDLVIGDAATLPFNNESFDIVLNYGAINGYSDIEQALSEMSRVLKKKGLILFLDEQLYPNASWIEKIYFKKVLSSHNVIHHCPAEFLPPNLTNIKIHQVYEFYYICTCESNGQ